MGQRELCVLIRRVKRIDRVLAVKYKISIAFYLESSTPIGVLAVNYKIFLFFLYLQSSTA